MPVVKKQLGFTILELMITISIFLAGILAIYGVAQQPLYFSSLFMSKFTASYLAQEGIENTRNIRDTNWINSLPWDAGLTNSQDTVFNKFTRSVTITPKTDSGGREYREVLVEVSWTERRQNNKIQAQENLYNWFD